MAIIFILHSNEDGVNIVTLITQKVILSKHSKAFRVFSIHFIIFTFVKTVIPRF